MILASVNVIILSNKICKSFEPSFIFSTRNIVLNLYYFK